MHRLNPNELPKKAAAACEQCKLHTRNHVRAAGTLRDIVQRCPASECGHRQRIDDSELRPPRHEHAAAAGMLGCVDAQLSTRDDMQQTLGHELMVEIVEQSVRHTCTK